MITKGRIAWCMILSAAFLLIVTHLLVIKTGPDIPKIYVENETIDLGVIDGLRRDPNKPERTDFRIENRGTGVLKLTGVHVGCACLRPQLDREVLLPSDISMLSVRLIVPNRNGQFQYKILLRSNDQNDPAKQLMIKGFVYRPCYVLPESGVVNNLRIGEKRRIELEVTGPADDNSFAIREVTAIGGKVQPCKIEKIGTVTATARCLWRIVLSVGSQGVHTWEDIIRISTSSEESPLLEVPVKVSELPPLKIDPAVVVFAHHANHKVPRAQVEITTNTSQSVEIVDIVKPRWIEMHIEPNGKNLPAKLNLTMRELPDRVGLSGNENIVLKLSEGLSEVRIPILVISGSAASISTEGRST